MEVLRISYIFVIKRSSKEIIFKAQNVRCYHLKDCCGHAHCLLYSILYTASSVLYGNFFLRALYPRVTLSKIYHGLFYPTTRIRLIFCYILSEECLKSFVSCLAFPA